MEHRDIRTLHNMSKTIQEMLAEKLNNEKNQPVEYIGTVEAYDKWAEVSLHPRRELLFKKYKHRSDK